MTERREAKTMTAADIAARIGGTVLGNAAAEARGVASLADAGPGDVSFLGNPKYEHLLDRTAAAVVLVPPDFATEPPDGRAYIRCAAPSDAFGLLVAEFAPPPVAYPPGVHPSAFVHPEARIAPSAHVGPLAVVEAGAVVGERSVVAAGTCIGPESVIGEDCLIHANVTVRERCLIGNRVIIHCGTVIGSDGFGYASGPAGHVKIPQVGNVRIDDDVEIGAQVAVDRARFGTTRIKRGAKIDNLVQVAHNVVIGEHALIIAQAGVAGSTTIGAGAVLAGQVGVAGHLEIGPGAMVGAQSGVGKDVPPRGAVFGSPAVDRREYARTQLNIHRLGALRESVKQLREELDELRGTLDG